LDGRASQAAWLSERAKRFYVHYGFQASTLHPMTLMMRLPSA
jgi:hypothetical protein